MRRLASVSPESRSRRTSISCRRSSSFFNFSSPIGLLSLGQHIRAQGGPGKRDWNAKRARLGRTITDGVKCHRNLIGKGLYFTSMSH